jgi:hypothetical protein
MEDSNHPYRALLSSYRLKLYDRRQRLSLLEEGRLKMLRQEVEGQDELMEMHTEIVALEDMNNIRKDAEMRRALISETSGLEASLDSDANPQKRDAASRRLDEIYSVLEPEYH